MIAEIELILSTDFFLTVYYLFLVFHSFYNPPKFDFIQFYSLLQYLRMAIAHVAPFPSYYFARMQLSCVKWHRKPIQLLKFIFWEKLPMVRKWSLDFYPFFISFFHLLLHFESSCNCISSRLKIYASQNFSYSTNICGSAPRIVLIIFISVYIN